MRKVLRWAGIILGGLAGLVVVVAAGLFLWSESLLARTYDVPPSGLALTSSPEAIERGRHLAVDIFLCFSCHGEDLGGLVMFDDFLTGRMVGSNLTTGLGGVGQRYSDEDWVRAVRNGVLPNGRAGIAMVSNIFFYLSDEDVAAIVAYVRSLPPVDNELPRTRIGPIGRAYVLLATGEILPASTLDHRAPRPPAPQPGVTAEYGEYLAHICTFCHGANYAGFALPEGQEPAPGETMPANLTPAGHLAQWTETDFLTTLRTGLTPEGKLLDPEAMPWRSLGRMTDEELKAIWLFLQTLPAAEAGPPP